MNLKVRLSIMNFLEFAVWGAYLTSMGNYLGKAGMGAEIYALAQNGIPSLPNSQSVKIAVREAIKMIHSTEESRNTILAQMQILCKTLPEYSVVRVYVLQ